MKSVLLDVLFLLCATCVFVDAETVSATEGDSVTLLTGVTQVQRDDAIEWRLNGNRIARISDGSSNTEGASKDRLQLNGQTGDLKITNIRTTDSGEYKLKIISTTGSPEKIFSVSVVPRPVSGSGGLSPGGIAGIVVAVIVAVVAAGGGGGYYYWKKGQML